MHIFTAGFRGAGIGQPWPSPRAHFNFLNHNYTKSLVNGTLVSGEIVLTKFRVKQVKWYQFIQNDVKFIFHSMSFK